MSAALIKAMRPHEQIILEPPRLINGSVTPVSGSMSVTPKMFSAVWKSISPAAAQAAIA